MICGKLWRGVSAGIDLAPENGCDQPGAVGEMPIKGADAHPRPLRDFPHRRIDPRHGEHGFGRFQKLLDIALRIGADTAGGPALLDGIGIGMGWIAAQAIGP